MNEAFMREAIRLARENKGGPFGAVVVRAAKIIGRGANRVTLDNDPTAHAEIIAIREACAALGTWALADCEIYCSCEPCPMCLSAIYWARIEKVFYAAERGDAAAIGFSDAFLYTELTRPIPDRQIPCRQILRPEALKVLSDWKANPSKVMY